MNNEKCNNGLKPISHVDYYRNVQLSVTSTFISTSSINYQLQLKMAGTLKKYFKGDPVIWIVILLLSIFSLLAVYSSTGSLAYRFQGGNTSYYILKHATILAMGIVITYVTHLIPYKYFSRIAQVLLVLAIPLLMVTLIFGVTRNQASRWLSVPGLGLTFQTSDIAKLAIVMYIARILAKKQENIKDFKTAFKPIVIPLMIICLLVLPANLSTSMLIFATAFILMFIGRINLKHLFGMVGVIIILLGSFIAIALSYDWQGRIGTWKNRIENYTSSDGGDSYQVSQAKIAIVSGGLVKLRPGKSIQRNFLPHPYSDFIYAIIIEEYGLAGGVNSARAVPVAIIQVSGSGKKELTNLSCLSCHWPGGNDYLPGHHQYGRCG